MRIKVQFKIEQALDRRIELFAAVNGTNKSNVVNEAVEKFLDEKHADWALPSQVPTPTCTQQGA